MVPDVRRTLGDYLERMAREHHLPKAIEALRGFAERFCRDAEMRAVVADLLAHVAPGAESGKALDALLSELRSNQETGEGPGGAVPHVRGLVFLDTDPDWTPGGSSAGLSASGGVERVEGLNTVQDTLGEVDPGLRIEGLESAEFTPPEVLDIERMDDLAQEESTFGHGIAVVSPDDLIQLDDLQDDPALGLIGGAEPPVEPVPLVSIGSPDLDLPPVGPALVVLDDEVAEDLLLDFEAEGAPAEVSAEVPPGADRSRPAVAQAPDPVAAAEARLAGFERAESWSEALQVAAELVRLQPDSIPRYQKQVELAYLEGDRDGLTARYLELGDALLRSGMRAPAVAVYRRVLEHEPGHPRALGALASLGVAVELPAAAPPAPPPEPEYVDLSALILDDQPARDSRMRVESAEPTAPDDEDRTFREILDQFKRGIEDNLDSEDFQAHYDLGIAFKEMGLLDEAIAQFQRALRWPEGRLKASEALGIAFHDKGRHAIAEAVLSRAIEGLPGTDDAKIGLIYWLGRALEAQGKEPAALGWYERALAVDIRFLDLADRIGRLGAGSSS